MVYRLRPWYKVRAFYSSEQNENDYLRDAGA